MSEITKGPWRVVDQWPGTQRSMIMRGDNEWVADCWKADAPLFASAPDLLEALREAREALISARVTLGIAGYFRDVDEIDAKIARIDAVLKKAGDAP